MKGFSGCGLMVLTGLCLLLPMHAASQPNANFLLTATVTEKQVVELTWTSPDDSSAFSYKVFRGILSSGGTVDTSIALVQIATTSDTILADTPKVSQPTTFMYVVRTTTGGGQNIRSSYSAARVVPVTDRVTVTSDPSRAARVGVLYTYQVTATSSDSSAVLRYFLLLKPGNMTIDSTTGFLQWTPALRGFRNVSILVASSKGGKTLQDFSVGVGAGNGTVTGAVHDSATGKTVRSVFIRLIQRNPFYHLSYHTVTDSTGSYTIHDVDPGSYYVHAYPFNPNLLPEWYNDVRFRIFASTASVADSPAVTVVNFALFTDSVHLPIFRASGTVTDTTGKVLRGALVVWARAEFAFNGSRFDPSDSTHDEDARESLDPNNPLPTLGLGFDDHSRWLYRAFTDSLGHYSLRLPMGFYVVRASHNGYYREFFNGEPNLFMADIIGLRRDTTVINFSLRPYPPVPLAIISGTVTDTASNKGVFARVIAYREWWTVHDTIPYHRHYVTDTDSLGNYTLADLPPGVYRVIAMPLGEYVPSWYTQSGLSTVYWRQATVLRMNGNDVADADINVRPILSSEFGYTSISGNVSSETQTGPSTMSAMATYPIPGGLVYAIDSSGGVAGYGITDASGNYAITGIDPGTYSMVMDSHDYLSSSASGVGPSYDVNGNDLPATQNFLTNTDLTGIQQSAPSGRPTSYALDQNYPNPFNPTTQIRFSVPNASMVSLVVYNILGQRIATLTSGLVAAGEHLATWNGRDQAGRAVASGVYFYRLQATGSDGTFANIKKMLLLK